MSRVGGVNISNMLAMLTYLNSCPGRTARAGDIATELRISLADVRKMVTILSGVSLGGGTYEESIILGGGYFDPKTDTDEDYAKEYLYLEEDHGIGRTVHLDKLQALQLYVALESLEEYANPKIRSVIKSIQEKIRLNMGIAEIARSIPDFEPLMLEPLRQAQVAGRRISIAYVDAAGQSSKWNLGPIRIATDSGNFLLIAQVKAGQRRVFRVDRITELAQLADAFEPSAADLSWDNHPQGELIEVRVRPDGIWLAEQLGVEVTEISRNEYSLKIALFNSNRREWLIKQLLALGSDLIDCSDSAALSEARDRAKAALTIG